MKNRWGYLVAMLVCIPIGLSTRLYGDRLPSCIADHAGDAIWALMVYFGFAFLLPRKSPVIVGLCAFAFAAAIECSQLIESTRFDIVRDTTLGRLIFGRGFLWIDFLRYAVGVVIGIGAVGLLGDEKLGGLLVSSKARRRRRGSPTTEE